MVTKLWPHPKICKFLRQANTQLRNEFRGIAPCHRVSEKALSVAWSGTGSHQAGAQLHGIGPTDFHDRQFSCRADGFVQGTDLMSSRLFYGDDVGGVPGGCRNASFGAPVLLAKSESSATSSGSTDLCTLEDLCEGLAPAWLLQRAEELGFGQPTRTQQLALPEVFAGHDCIIHAQTGSGKTLAYLLPLIAKVNAQRASVQALVVVPTRELGMQVARVARHLVGKGDVSTGDRPQPVRPEGEVDGKKERAKILVMALLDGSTASRQKSWLKADPPQIVVGTPDQLYKMVKSGALRTSAICFLVVDEVDAVLETSKVGSGSFQKLLSSCPPPAARQTLFVSATVPQHHRFLHECVQNKWTKADVKHVHVEAELKVPFFIRHRYEVCARDEKLECLAELIRKDSPQAAIVFTNELSEKARRVGGRPPAELVAEYLTDCHLAAGEKSSEDDPEAEQQLAWQPLVLQEDASSMSRTSVIQEFRDGNRRILVSTELAARGLDLPEVRHVYNFDLPSDSFRYVHRAGRTGRRPLTEEEGIVTSIITPQELFVLERIGNELRVPMLRVSSSGINA